MSLVFILLGTYRTYAMYLNKKRDSVRLVDKDVAARTGFLDITDHENENFRYDV
jgi:hypothetical protein